MNYADTPTVTATHKRLTNVLRKSHLPLSARATAGAGANKSSSVISDCTLFLYMLWTNPFAVTVVINALDETLLVGGRVAAEKADETELVFLRVRRPPKH